MGKSASKRRTPRIVKKSRAATKMKRVNHHRLPEDLKKHWDKEKTPSQNFKNLGLVMNNRPSLRQTLEGQALLSEARVRMNPEHYEKKGVTVETEVQETVNLEELHKKPIHDMANVFTDLKKREDCTITKTKGRLKWDEKTICEKLIKKYGEEAHFKMAKDIKINYLQWSKGQCAKNVELYLATK